MEEAIINKNKAYETAYANAGIKILAPDDVFNEHQHHHRFRIVMPGKAQEENQPQNEVSAQQLKLVISPERSELF